MRSISNSDDVIDSRDVMSRIEELEGEREDAAYEAEWDGSDEGLELASLRSLAEECERCASDWEHGAVLVRDSHFTEYTERYVNDTSPQDLSALIDSWIGAYLKVDWEAAAADLQRDYTSVDFDGVTYWVRS